MARRIVVAFRNSGTPATGLSPTIDVWEVDATPTEVVTAAAMTEIGDGLYFYDFAEDPTLDYAFRADGTGTITDDAERYVFGGLEIPLVNRDSVRSDSEGVIDGTITAAKFATDAVDANALATDAANEVATATDTTLTASHGAGNWITATGFSTHSATDVVNEFAEIRFGPTYDDTSGSEAVNMSISLTRGGATVTSGITGGSVTWYNPDGTQLFNQAFGAVADATGQIDLTESQTLTASTAYFAVVTVTDGTGTVTRTKKVPTSASA